MPEPWSNSINTKSQSGQFSVISALVRYSYLKNLANFLQKMSKESHFYRKDLVYSPM